MNKYHKRYNKRKESGTCTHCGGLRDITTSMSCRKCSDQKHQSRNQNKILGLCGCGNKPTIGKCCDYCKLEAKDRARKKTIERKSLGLCLSCNEYALPGLLRCRTHCLIVLSWNLFSTKDKWVLLDDMIRKQNSQCAYCQNDIEIGNNAELDHIQPKSRFPERFNDLDNLQWLCVVCNTAKSNLTELEFMDWLKRISSSLQTILQN